MAAGVAERNDSEVGVPAGTPIDGVLFDLDGVVYHGEEAVPGAVECIADLHERAIPVGYVTNNATRTAAAVADRISGLGIPTTDDEVITSAQVLAARLAEEYGAGARILLVGTTGLEQALMSEGLVVVDSLADSPAALAQGLDPEIDYSEIVRAAEAITTGLDWWASNPDFSMVGRASRVPGNGAFIAMLSGLTGRQPRIVGKPAPDVIAHAGQRLGAMRPFMVGDRLDTDIEGGNRAGFDTVLVLTGVHDLHDALTADPIRRPRYVLPTLADLPRVLETDSEERSGHNTEENEVIPGNSLGSVTTNGSVTTHGSGGEAGAAEAGSVDGEVARSVDGGVTGESQTRGDAVTGSGVRIVESELVLDDAALTSPEGIEAALHLAWRAIDSGESVAAGNLPRRIDD